MRRIVLIIHNVRSAHNVGSIFRTAEGLGVEKLYLSGYTPYPSKKDDERLPHIQHKIEHAIHKTALGAENIIKWEHVEDFNQCLNDLNSSGFLVAALEQSARSIELDAFTTDKNVALVLGNEVDGLNNTELERIKYHLEIPMLGQKESFNVAVAAGMALYHLRYSA